MTSRPMSTCTKTVAEGILEGQLQDRTGRECCQDYSYYDRSNAEPGEPHRQRALGNLPSGNSRSRNTTRPMAGIQTHDQIQIDAAKQGQRQEREAYSRQREGENAQRPRDQGGGTGA